MRYRAIVEKDPDSDYGVWFPDLPGCVSAGSTLEEAYWMAHEALSLGLEGFREDGEPIPEPTAIQPGDTEGEPVAIILVDPDLTYEYVRWKIDKAVQAIDEG